MRPHPRRTVTDRMKPAAWGTCDRSGFIDNHHNLCWQYEWAGDKLINLKILVTPDMLDQPQRQLGTIILPPDPLPIRDARPEQYAIDEMPVSTRTTMDGRVRVLMYGPAPKERIITVPGNLMDP